MIYECSEYCSVSVSSCCYYVCDRMQKYLICIPKLTSIKLHLLHGVKHKINRQKN